MSCVENTFWHGYGVRVDDLWPLEGNTTPERILTVMADNCPDDYNAISQYLDEEVGEGEWTLDSVTFDDLECFESEYGESIIPYVLRCVLGQKLPVFSAKDYEGEAYVLYGPRYPWEMTVQEQFLTEADVAAAFTEVIEMLTDVEFELDYHQVENGC